MRSLLFYVGFILLGGSNVKAQEVNFGAKGGINISTLRGDGIHSTQPTVDVHLGAMAEIKINEKFSFQPELIFSGQGTRTDEYNLKLKYMHFPLMAKYYIKKPISIEVGPQIGFLTMASASGFDVRNQVKKFDLGINAGVGYKTENGLTFSARYNYGITNINQYSGDKIVNQNSVIQISAGLFFY